jgi:excinuclease ABC subunit B
VEESLAVYQNTRKNAEMVLKESGNFDVTQTLNELQQEMLEAANNLEFEKAALLRDQIRELKRSLGGDAGSSKQQAKPTTYKVRRKKNKVT